MKGMKKPPKTTHHRDTEAKEQNVMVVLGRVLVSEANRTIQPDIVPLPGFVPPRGRTPSRTWQQGMSELVRFASLASTLLPDLWEFLPSLPLRVSFHVNAGVFQLRSRLFWRDNPGGIQNNLPLRCADGQAG
jgi:hypothetical protein